MARAQLREGDPARVGRYRLTARLGAGGMGVVYLGEAHDGNPVAVKVLRPELADDAEFRKRFGREVATLLRVKGVCTVRVLEADTGSARPFLVTEYVDGPSLAEYVEASGPLEAGMLYGLATGLAEALTAIHAAGVVHRDLKPSNVLLTGDGPKVIDFGIAQALDATTVTKTGVTVGSAGFMAPEQVMGRALTASDIFAWAVTVGYAASGQPPFGTGASDAILFRILHAEPDISAVPSALRPHVLAALAKNPEDRPTARQLLAQLAGTSAPSDSSDDTPTLVVLSQTWRPAATGSGVPAATASSVRLAARRPPRRVPVLAVALSAAALLAGAGTATGLTLSARHVTAHPAALHHSAAPASGHAPPGTQAAAMPSPPASPASPSPSRTPASPAGPSPSSTLAPTATPSQTVTTTQPAPAPVLTVGSFSGQRPSKVYFSGDSGNIVVRLSWASWTATGATGYGTSYLQDCVPDCATGKMTPVPATLVLSDPVNGRFTVITEKRNGTTMTFTYPGSWAQYAA